MVLARQCGVWERATHTHTTTLIAVRIVLLAIAVLVVPLGARAQQATKVPRIGVLLSSTHVEALKQGLHEHGYVEGRNIAIEYRYGDVRPDRLAKLAAELVGLDVALIVTSGTPSTRAAQQATRTIPIVMTLVGDPNRFVASLAKPGGNITGLTQLSQELDGKRLELLNHALPKVSRVAVLIDPERSVALQPTRTAAEALGVQLLPIELRAPNPDLEAAFRTATKERVGALVVTPGPATERHRKRIVDLAAKNRLPAMYGAREFVDLGGLMSYGPSQPDLFRRAAGYVDKILKGAKPAELPVEQPTKFELVINVKTATALGLTIPPSVVLRADEVIQ
jgi:putative ABC transport system substrate-binding protein